MKIISYNYTLEIEYYENNKKCGEIFLYRDISRMVKNEKQSRYPTRNKELVRKNMIKPGG